MVQFQSLSFGRPSTILISYNQKQSCWFVFLKNTTSCVFLFKHDRMKGDSTGLRSLSALYKKLYAFGLIFF